MCICHVCDIFFSLSQPNVVVHRNREKHRCHGIVVIVLSHHYFKHIYLANTTGSFPFHRVHIQPNEKDSRVNEATLSTRIYVGEAGLMEIYTVPQSQQNFLPHTFQYYVPVDIDFPSHPLLSFSFFNEDVDMYMFITSKRTGTYLKQNKIHNNVNKRCLEKIFLPSFFVQKHFD